MSSMQGNARRLVPQCVRGRRSAARLRLLFVGLLIAWVLLGVGPPGPLSYAQAQTLHNEESDAYATSG